MTPEINFTLPLSLFLIPYALFLVVFLFYLFFTLQHLVVYGVYGKGLYTLVTIFFGGSAILIAASVLLLSQFDWSLTLSLDTLVQAFSFDATQLF